MLTITTTGVAVLSDRSRKSVTTRTMPDGVDNWENVGISGFVAAVLKAFPSLHTYELQSQELRDTSKTSPLEVKTYEPSV